LLGVFFGGKRFLLGGRFHLERCVGVVGSKELGIK